MRANKIAVCIPCHNNLDVLKKSVPSVYSDNLFFVVFDDGSTDGTDRWLKEHYPKIQILNGNGLNWWTGSTKKAIDYCMSRNMDYILSLNADVVITPDMINSLILCSKTNNDSIVASLVVDIDNPEKVLWSGSIFEKLNRFLPIYTSKYLVKAGSSVSKVPSNAYEVDEVHGRGVLIPSNVIDSIGNYDSETFPHYGGDTDFSLRAKRRGIKMFVNPSSKAKVFVDNTSLNKKESGSFFDKIISIKNHLFKRKNGEAIFVWWRLYRRHLPLAFLLQSYLFVILLNIYRKLTN